MMSDYEMYLETAWEWMRYFSYLMVTYVLLTLLPKSLKRMKRFADADYEANRQRFHRCYGPDLCCHAHLQGQEAPVKQKQRKPVTRVYPKRQQPQVKEEVTVAPPVVKRSNVTKIARMFETGNATRQVSRVLPEIRMFGASEESNESTPCASRKGSIATQLSAQLQHIEHAMQLWQEHEEEQQHQQQHKSSKISDWEPIAVPLPAIRRTRGTSATPSTASPLSSSPEPASPVLLRQPPALCLKSSMEDIFQAIARSAEESVGSNSLSPIQVTCIDDILSERRFSRPLSAYSITDLLNEEQESIYVNETTLQPVATS
ncbi:AF4/FMR2 family member lilli [Drosophila innubila]|uniref:AF4/FMR2 family member lilli n=1 Tax=Drosophila innubila TaxID=198719 RepID=UPI00148D77B3|nr:AF4/FMR2 family member lilli [Drosophila innubila]XP_034483227.1 AF4/FMR2 family member lilli [Drosophila innubila]XP_034483228.1 AF4/FMR2 family member lilli [Drosophila innubila]